MSTDTKDGNGGWKENENLIEKIKLLTRQCPKGGREDLFTNIGSDSWKTKETLLLIGIKRRKKKENWEFVNFFK